MTGLKKITSVYVIFSVFILVHSFLEFMCFYSLLWCIQGPMGVIDVCLYRAVGRSGPVGPGVAAGFPSGRSDRRQRAAEWLQPENKTPLISHQQTGCDLLHEEHRTYTHTHTHPLIHSESYTHIVEVRNFCKMNNKTKYNIK